jgi:hypothetical protein
LAEDPDSEDAQGALRLQLRKLFEGEPTLAHELEQILQSARSDGVVAGRDANVVHGGVHADRGGVAVGRNIGGNVSTTSRD